MNNLYEILKKHDIHPLSYIKKGKIYIVKDKNNTYAVKLNTSNYDIYKYLESRDFLYFPENFNKKNDNYDLCEYIEDIETSDEQKINDLIILLSILHYKSSYMREVDLDEIKKMYEETKKNIFDTKNYYLTLNDSIDKETFYSPSKYLLVRNISLVYYILEYANNMLNKWYKAMSNKKVVRVSLLHNNIDIHHLIINNNKYLVSWDKAYFDYPLYDIESFYRKYYKKMQVKEMFDLYETKNKLSDDEKELILIKLMIPRIINFTNNTFFDTQRINNEIIFLNKIYNYLKEMDTKKKVTNSTK